MNLRRQKRFKLSLMHFALFGARGPIGQYLTPAKSYGSGSLVATFREAAGITKPKIIVLDGVTSLGKLLAAKIARDKLIIDAAAVRYTVARKKDGEIVGTFCTLEEAEAEVAKAKRAKKAALEIL